MDLWFLSLFTLFFTKSEIFMIFHDFLWFFMIFHDFSCFSDIYAFWMSHNKEDNTYREKRPNDHFRKVWKSWFYPLFRDTAIVHSQAKMEKYDFTKSKTWFSWISTFWPSFWPSFSLYFHYMIQYPTFASLFKRVKRQKNHDFTETVQKQ